VFAAYRVPPVERQDLRYKPGSTSDSTACPGKSIARGKTDNTNGNPMISVTKGQHGSPRVDPSLLLTAVYANLPAVGSAA
jgi:hypothetical protein